MTKTLRLSNWKRDEIYYGIFALSVARLNADLRESTEFSWKNSKNNKWKERSQLYGIHEKKYFHQMYRWVKMHFAVFKTNKPEKVHRQQRMEGTRIMKTVKTRDKHSQRRIGRFHVYGGSKGIKESNILRMSPLHLTVIARNRFKSAFTVQRICTVLHMRTRTYTYEYKHIHAPSIHYTLHECSLLSINKFRYSSTSSLECIKNNKYEKDSCLDFLLRKTILPKLDFEPKNNK